MLMRRKSLGFVGVSCSEWSAMSRPTAPKVYKSGFFADSIQEVPIIDDTQRNLLNGLYLGGDKPLMVDENLKESIIKLQKKTGYVKLVGKSDGRFYEMTDLGRLLSPVDTGVYFKKYPDPIIRNVHVYHSIIRASNC